MIVNATAYRDGHRLRESLSISEAAALAHSGDGFVWVGVHQPDPREFDEIATEFGFHELAVEDAVKAHQRPKVERYDDTLLVVVKTASYVDSEEVIDVGELLLFVNPGFVVTVRHGDGSLASVRERVEQRPDLLRSGAGTVLYSILDHVVDQYEAAAEGFEEDVQEVEREVFSSERSNPAKRIYKLEREVLDFHGAVVPLAAVLDEIVRGGFDVVPEQLLNYFRDVQDHQRRAAGRIAGFRELLNSALQANLTQVSVRQNEDMRKISAWVAILAIPTMVAGIYGMNFEEMPELRWRFGYPAVLVFVAIVCLILYRRFRRAGWL